MTDNNKHLVHVGHEFAAAMSDDTPIITIAKMVTELASALDVQSARSDALAAELKQSKIDAGCYKHGMEQSNKRLTEIAAENAALKAICEDRRTFIMNGVQLGYIQVPTVETDPALETIRIAVSPQEPTPATDAWVNEQRAAARKEGAYFVANRMLAAWDAGFINDTAKNAADIARMILTSTEFMTDAPDGDFNRSFADSLLGEIAAQLRGSQV